MSTLSRWAIWFRLWWAERSIDGPFSAVASRRLDGALLVWEDRQP
jgi:hypothetical protein